MMKNVNCKTKQAIHRPILSAFLWRGVTRVTWQLFIIILPAAAAAADYVQFINVVCFCHHRTSLLCLNTVVIAAGRRLILSANREQRASLQVSILQC